MSARYTAEFIPANFDSAQQPRSVLSIWTGRGCASVFFTNGPLAR
jgi:hypothetical protein